MTGYYPPTVDELAEMWDTGDIIVDANVLLNLYRYSERSTNETLAVLGGFSERLWLPHQVAFEFHRNRLSVIETQKNAFEAVGKILRSAEDRMKSELSPFKKHPSLDTADIVESFSRLLQTQITRVEDLQRSHPDLPQSANEDPVSVSVASLFDGRVGDPYSADDERKKHDIAAKRYATRTPPGYEDAKKPEPERYGDYVLWSQILDYSRGRPGHVIFVTDDSKEDWWWKEQGRTQGPRPELVAEFHRETGKRIHFYSPEQFLTYARTQLEAVVSQSTLDEVERISVRHDLDKHDQVDRLLMAQDIRLSIRSLRFELHELNEERFDPDAGKLRSHSEARTKLLRRKARLKVALNQEDDVSIRSDVMEEISAINDDLDFHSEAMAELQVLGDESHFIDERRFDLSERIQNLEEALIVLESGQH